jgi:hypothetical protein
MFVRKNREKRNTRSLKKVVKKNYNYLVYEVDDVDMRIFICFTSETIFFLAMIFNCVDIFSR